MGKAQMNPRTCIVTRQEMSPEEMIRFVCGPDNQVVPDIKQCLPGRGVWVTAKKKRIEEAVKRQLFRQGFKSQITANDDLADFTAALLYKDVLGSLSLAKKAGQAVISKTKVEAEIRKCHVSALIHAKDASENGVAKINALATAILEQENKAMVISYMFSGEELDKALGGTNIAHVALIAGGATTNLMTKLEKLEKFWSEPGK